MSEPTDSRPRRDREGELVMSLRKGFTLIELLVVIAIISLLATLLVPALGRAKEIARRAKCSTNLHTIGRAVSMYAANNDSRLPSTADQSAFSLTLVGKSSRTEAPSGGSCSHSRAWYLLVRGKFAQTTAFACPSDNGVSLVKGSPAQYYDFQVDRGGYPISYAMQVTHQKLDGSGKVVKGLTLTSIDPGAMPIVADDNSLLSWSDSTTYWRANRNSLPFRNGPGINSTNHGKEGQNVLAISGRMTWETTPMVGIGGDNIYVPGSANPGSALPRSYPESETDSVFLP